MRPRARIIDRDPPAAGARHRSSMGSVVLLVLLVLLGICSPRVGAGADGDRPADLLAGREQARLHRDYVVVLDPGHGGKDRGTAGIGLGDEKDVVLGIARAAAEHLRLHSGVDVLLTRTRDVFVPLEDRLERTRRSGADVFVSIHANSAPSRRARGAEVYFLSPDGARDATARASEDRENAALLVGEASADRAGDELLSILVDLKGTAALKRSELLAERMLERLRADGRVTGRSVRQANFVVLRTLNMPSILVEVGFLSHPQEARWLASAEGQAQLGYSLAAGVIDFLREAGDGIALEALPPPRVHAVRRGETLWSLAREGGLGVDALRRLNALPRSDLRVGQVLLLPAFAGRGR